MSNEHPIYQAILAACGDLFELHERDTPFRLWPVQKTFLEDVMRESAASMIWKFVEPVLEGKSATQWIEENRKPGPQCEHVFNPAAGSEEIPCLFPVGHSWRHSWEKPCRDTKETGTGFYACMLAVGHAGECHFCPYVTHNG